MFQKLLVPFLCSIALVHGIPGGQSVTTRTQDDYGNYAFGYDIVDEYGAANGRQEKGDAHGNKVGSYIIKDIDGRSRRVDYVADAYGFRATIGTNEPGTATSAVGDATYLSSAPILTAEPAKILAAPAPLLTAPALIQTSYAAPAPLLAAPLIKSYAAPAQLLAPAPLLASAPLYNSYAAPAPLLAPAPLAYAATKSYGALAPLELSSYGPAPLALSGSYLNGYNGWRK